MPDHSLLLDRNFIGKRLALALGIFLFVSTGVIPSPEKAVASSYYAGSFAPVVQHYSLQQDDIPLPKKSLAVASEEVVQSVVPTSTPTPVYGKSRQVDEHTWTIQVGEDSQAGSAQEIFAALNVYRQQKGKAEVSWDTKLADYAQGRANTFSSNHNLDNHAGFQDFIHNQDGFNKVGFFALGENSSIGYHVSGTHLIEWVYAGDAPHDENQLSSTWTHVGVGVSGDATDLVFGGNKQ
jgi:uncharacterized protein YkwD